MGSYIKAANIWGVVTQKLNGQRGSVYDALKNLIQISQVGLITEVYFSC